MDIYIYTFSRAETIQEELEELRNEKDIWEGATSFCSGTEIWDGNHKYVIRTSLIDFKELKNRTLAYIDSKIEALEKEFKEL